MIHIRLAGSAWSYDPGAPLGVPGGFGAVFRGVAVDGSAVAVKRLHVNAAQAAHRELTVARDLAQRVLQHVLPVLDAGQDSESDGYFIVMPVADGNLEDYLRDKGPLAEVEARDTLLQILTGLEEANHLVHRDLKPANILHHEGRWKIADFGIARFVEDSTSAQTVKECLSPEYAAPEQWLYEHATAATDVYAVGCIAYAILGGTPPFTGSIPELQEKHLHVAPPDLPGAGPQLRAVVAMMLRKVAAARPSRNRVRAILESMSPATAPVHDTALDRLAVAAAAHEQNLTATEAEQRRLAAIAKQRSSLGIEAQAILRGTFDALTKRITESVPTATVHTKKSSWTITVGPAMLEVKPSSVVLSAGAFPLSKWDVIATATIRVRQSTPTYSRSASLWYTRQTSPTAGYRWYEVGYGANPLSGHAFQYEPVALDPAMADRAHSGALDLVQTMYAPATIDDEDTESFCRRWAHVLAEACAGRLHNMPSSLPLVS